MKKISIYTDGACSGNPGPGGWGAVLIYNSTKKDISGFAENTTNNRMELQAVIESLISLKSPCEVDLYTDSKYVQEGITKWIFGWLKNGWRNSKKEEVKNSDLWKQLLEVQKPHKVKWHWVKGHADNEMNNRADNLARTAIENSRLISKN